MHTKNIIIGIYPFSDKNSPKKDDIVEKWRYIQTEEKEDCKNCGVREKCTMFSPFILASGDSVLVKGQNYKSISEEEKCKECIRKNGVFAIDCINCKRNTENPDMINRNLLYLLGNKSEENPSTIDEIVANNIEQFHVGIIDGEPVLFFDTMFSTYKDSMTPEQSENISKIFGVYTYYLRERPTGKEQENIENSIFKDNNRIVVFDSDYFWDNVSEIEEMYKNRDNIKNLHANFAFWGMKLLYLEPMTKNQFSKLTIGIELPHSEDSNGLFCKDVHTGFTFFLEVDGDIFMNLDFIITSEHFDKYCSFVRNERINKEEEQKKISYDEIGDLIMNGKKVRRKSWKSDIYLTGNHDMATDERYIIMHFKGDTGNYKITVWNPTQNDREAEDYEVVS